MSVQTAVVVGVGSSAGLGAALARRFAKEGLWVIVSHRGAHYDRRQRNQGHRRQR
ncbi:MAG: hypothetical protein WBF49_08895 [Methyloceanibacter sp.]